MTERGRCASGHRRQSCLLALSSARAPCLAHPQGGNLVEWRIDTGRTTNPTSRTALGHLHCRQTPPRIPAYQATASICTAPNLLGPIRSREHITAPFAVPPKMKLAHHPSFQRPKKANTSTCSWGTVASPKMGLSFRLHENVPYVVSQLCFSQHLRGHQFDHRNQPCLAPERGHSTHQNCEYIQRKLLQFFRRLHRFMGIRIAGKACPRSLRC